MATKDSKQEKKLSDKIYKRRHALDIPERKKIEAGDLSSYLADIMIFARAKRNKLIDNHPFYNFDPSESNAVIEILADMLLVLDAGKAGDKKKTEIFLDLENDFEWFEKILDEIQELHEEVRSRIGFAKVVVEFDREFREVGSDTWRDAALQYFDDNAKSFRHVKREYLEQHPFCLSKTNEARDFREPLLQMIIREEGHGEIVKTRLRKFITEFRKKKNS